MGKFVKGEVVVIPFPFSDLTVSKPRPALVVAELLGDDVILCQITTANRPDGYSIPLSASDFASGTIHQNSFIRPSRLFTGDSNIITKAIGKLSAAKMAEVEKKIIAIITA